MRQEYLPEEFLKQMKVLLSSEYESYLDTFEEKRLYGLRVNTRKISPQSFEKIAPFPIEPVSFISNGYYYNGETKPAKDPYYYAGLYYLQEPSAMTPASLLPIKPGDMVLDLCAAPGGKSTELGARLRGTGMLFSNDISNTRAKALLKNLELFGIPNICVTSETPEKLSDCFKACFDKILIDAPCSGEGMFRKDDSMVKSWLEHGPEYYSQIQKEIVSKAVKMLKPGGMMLYSTCTFDKRENEDVISFLLSQNPDLSLVDLEKRPGFSDGLGLTSCIRLFPHKIKGEGHFIALMEKQSQDQAIDRKSSKENGYTNIEKYKDLKDFLSLISWEWDKERFLIKNDGVYYLPEGCELQKGLRYLRTGLFLGELRRERFEPSQALAMALKKEAFQKTMDFSRQDERVIRYLKGETISVQENTKGWYLVCVDGYPLGFAKGNGYSLKNKYYPGWRWQ